MQYCYLCSMASQAAHHTDLPRQITKQALLVQVPCAATVYCQPIQMRCSNALGFDVEQTNQWRWRPDYEGLDLADRR